ncbi:WD repeat-containing protein 41 [Bombina bombina]|uniref:WD repeat-containing protein 41 n=1 Tax=Bombina bombina TaxID=8345 RepID=UPI00235AF27D|nr:WD repeat-containing protein 41 [Bombina bombina]
MLRWFMGSREPQGGAEKSLVLNIGEEQTQNHYTELTALKVHSDIVRFLVQIDDCRFASACDDGSVYIWDVKTGEVLFELQGHKQKITAVVVFKTSEHFEERIDFILTASADKTVIAWNCETGQQIQTATDFQSPVKTLTVLQRLDVWLSGGGELRVWNREFKLLCETGYFMDRGISALIELPKNCVAAAVGKDLSIFKLSAASGGFDRWDITQIKCISSHQDNVRALISVNDLTFVSGSDAGELIVWDAIDWTIQSYERSFLDTSSPQEVPQEIKLMQRQEVVSIQHLASDGEYIFAGVGKGIYVYKLETKRIITAQKRAHDLNIEHLATLPNRQLVSCSEDGSVRIWELRLTQHLHAEPVQTGFFSIWGFGKSNKQSNQTIKKKPDNCIVASLDLIGDLIGHSSTVQMFLYCNNHGLVTCSADHLIILWKEGKKESRLRSQMLFHKLEENWDPQLRFSLS